MKIKLTEKQYKMIIKEQTNQDKIYTSNGNIIMGNNTYQLQADTIIPFASNKIINVKSINNKGGSFIITYIDPDTEETKEKILDNEDLVNKIKEGIKKGMDKINIPIDEILYNLLLVKV
jgi:hypothetical protein